MRKWTLGTGILVALSLAIVTAGPAIACGSGGVVSEAHDTGETTVPMEDEPQPMEDEQPQTDETQPQTDETQPQMDETQPQSDDEPSMEDEPTGDEAGEGAQGDPTEVENR